MQELEIIWEIRGVKAGDTNVNVNIKEIEQEENVEADLIENVEADLIEDEEKREVEQKNGHIDDEEKDNENEIR